jgi:hypothetical protein
MVSPLGILHFVLSALPREVFPETEPPQQFLRRAGKSMSTVIVTKILLKAGMFIWSKRRQY